MNHESRPQVLPGSFKLHIGSLTLIDIGRRADGGRWFHIGPWGKTTVGDCAILTLPFFCYTRLGIRRRVSVLLGNWEVWNHIWGGWRG
jgi:hypothetical protein